MSSKPFDFSDFEMTGSSGIDSHFQRESAPPVTVKQASMRKKVASLGDLSSFIRLSSEQLIHRSSRDLWSLKKEGDGSFYIERLFDDDGHPLKG